MQKIISSAIASLAIVNEGGDQDVPTSILSFLTGGDVMTRIASNDDREQIGSITATTAMPTPAFASTRRIRSGDEGIHADFLDRRRTGIPFRRHQAGQQCAGTPPERLRQLLVLRSGDLFDASALDKTTEALAIEMAKLGYPFAHADAPTRNAERNGSMSRS